MPSFGMLDYTFVSRYSYLNATSLSDLFIKILLNPLVVIKHLLSSSVIDYLLGMIGLLFLPLFSPATLIASGVLIQNCLTDHWGMLNFTSHYSAAITPVLLMASIASYAKLLESQKNLLKLLRIF